MLKKYVIAILVVGLLSGCTIPPPPKPKLNPLQIQTLQTQAFTAAKRTTFNAVMTVLQNNGYLIQSANFKTGYITAKSPTSDKSFIAGDGSLQHEIMKQKMAGIMVDVAIVGVMAAVSHGGVYGGADDMNTGEPTRFNYAVSVSVLITTKKKVNSKVRLNFVQNAVATGQGTQKQDTQILATTLYKKTFNDIRQQIFVAADIK